jgi:hypothetical protein
MSMPSWLTPESIQLEPYAAKECSASVMFAP